MAEIIRKHFLISGRVQGVGFRYKAYHLAQRYRVTGWVKNLPDGSVEMEAEGTNLAISEMLRMLMEDRYIQIDNMRERKIPVEDDRSFSIDY